MKKTKESKKTTKAEKKEKIGVGDIIFRAIIMISIFLICIIFSVFYIKNMSQQINNNNNITIQDKS